MPADWRDDRDDRVDDLELERESEPVLEDAALAGLKDDATLEQLEVTLAKLRQLCERAERGQLEADDWAIVSALLDAEMVGRMT